MNTVYIPATGDAMTPAYHLAFVPFRLEMTQGRLLGTTPARMLRELAGRASGPAGRDGTAGAMNRC